MNHKLSKNSQLFLCIFLFNTLLCLYSIFFLTPVSSSNDDFFLGAIAGNAFGTDSQFLIYMSTLLGYFLKLFYTLFPNVNWYALFLYTFMLLSVVVIEYIIITKYKITGMLLSLFFSIGFSHYFYVVFQYTKAASLLTLTGFIIIFYWIDVKKDAPKRRGIKYLLAFLFLFTGSLVRLQPFFMVCLFGFGLWILKLMASVKEHCFPDFFKHYITPFIFIFSLILGFCWFEENIWDVSTEEKAYFKEYNKVRTELVDYEIPSYEEHQTEYMELNLSANDVENIKRWCFSDSEKFSLEVLQKVASMNKKNHFNLTAYLKYIRDSIITHTIFKVCMFLTLLCLLFSKRKKILNILLPHAAFLFVVTYLNYIGRITEWVLNSLWIVYFIFVILTVCECFPSIRFSKRTQKKVLALSLCGSIFFNSDILITRALTKQPIHQNLYHCINTLSNTKNMNYFCDVTSVYQMSREFKILEKTPKNFFSNIFFCGAWFSCSPLENHTKKAAGIKNLYKDLLYKEDYVALDGEAIEQKLVYFMENYSTSAKFSKIQDLYGYPIYKFSDTFTGKRIPSTKTATLHMEHTADNYQTLLGTLDCSSAELDGNTIYLEVKAENGTVTGTFAGRFEQQNADGLYSLRYQKNLPETNAFTFQIPDNTALSTEYTYTVLLRDGDSAKTFLVEWN